MEEVWKRAEEGGQGREGEREERKREEKVKLGKKP